LQQGNNKCTHFEDQVTVVTLWELPGAFFRNGLSSGLHMGGNIPISISPSSEESFFFCLLPHSLLSGSLCNVTDDTWHTNVTGHYKYVIHLLSWKREISMPTVSHDGLSVSGLLWIHELLTSKHRATSIWQSRPFVSTF